MSTMAIITARSKSKRIPLKNIKEFCGKPIMVYSIEAALKSSVFDEVMVSTDSDQFAEIAKKAGAAVPFLRKEFNEICCIYPTAPFVTAQRLSDALGELNRRQADSIMTVVRYGFPPQRGFVIRDNCVSFLHPEFERTRSQDLEPIYHDCGQFYIIKTKALLKYKSLIVPNTIPYIMPDEEVQDIDTMSDWEIAEAKYRVLHKGE